MLIPASRREIKIPFLLMQKPNQPMQGCYQWLEKKSRSLKSIQSKGKKSWQQTKSIPTQNGMITH